jgi:hypothetical protein
VNLRNVGTNLLNSAALHQIEPIHIIIIIIIIRGSSSSSSSCSVGIVRSRTRPWSLVFLVVVVVVVVVVVFNSTANGVLAGVSGTTIRNNTQKYTYHTKKT